MKIRLHIYLVFLAVTVSNSDLLGQDHLSSLSRRDWIIEKIDLPGIGSTNIFEEIVQDSFGFLWIGTADGLIRYDGHQTKVFVHDPDDSNSLSSSDISELLLEDDRYLWIGTYRNRGLNRMDLSSGCITHYLDSASVTEIIQDNDGNIWVGSNQGLYRFDPDTKPVNATRYILEDDASSLVWSIDQDRNGTIWAGITPEGGLFKYLPDTDSFQLFPLRLKETDELFDNPVSALLEDSHGILWIGTSDGELFQMDRQTSTLESIHLTPPAEGKSWISTIYEDLEHKIWIVTAGCGLFRIDPLTKEHIHFDANSSERQIPSDIGWTIYQAKDSVYWVGTGRRGGMLFKLFETTPQLINYDIKGLSAYSFLENNSSSENEVWIGTDDGIVLFDLTEGIKKHFSQDLLLPETEDSIIIHSLRQDTNSTIWAACLAKNDRKFNGLLEFNPSQQQFRIFSIPFDNLVPIKKMELFYDYSISDLEIISGKIVIATIGTGLHVFDPQKEQFVVHQNVQTRIGDPKSGFISDLFKNKEGTIYIAGWQPRPEPGSFGSKFLASAWGPKFLAILNPDFTSLVNLEFPVTIKWSNRRYVEELFDARNAGIWLQTRRDGLIQLDSQMAVVRTVNSMNTALPPEDISTAIQVGEQFWIKSDNLIYRFDPQSGEITSNLIQCDNCENYETSIDPFYSFRSALHVKDSTILFGNTNGFLRLYPQLSNQSLATRVVFSSLDFLEGKRTGYEMPIDYQGGKTITLKHNENNFRIRFFIPDYRNQENNRYEFRLDNYDIDWIPAGVEPEALYRRVTPGHYRFWVRARGYRYSNEIENSIQINILPPWYWAWWSKSLYFLLITSIIYWFYQFQLKRQLAIAEASRLKELDSFKSRLYTNITHEFRTPLTVILGLADQLQEKVIESGKEGLQMIKRNGNRLFNLVNQILDLQKIEAGAMPIHLIRGDIVHFLKYLVESFHSYAESKDIRLQFNAHPDSVFMDYDPQKLQDIFSNLVSNALKFTPSGGSIQIDCRQVNSHQFQINVRDNGIGISEEKIPYIFDRFYQADDSSIRKSEGTGIGLALTRELVKLLGGEISVRSILGAGSEFMVLLPINQSTSLATNQVPVTQLNIASLDPVTPQPIHAGSNSKDLPQILIIEDNQDVVHYITSILQEDYNITTARDGREGIGQAFESIPDLIISDVMMPHMDGYQVCKTLKHDTRTSHIPVILLTAKADIDSKLEGLQYGADAYLTKPFLKDELLVRIQSLLTQKQRLQAHYLQLYGVVKDAHSEAEPEKISIPENEFIAKIRSIINDHLDDSTFGVDQLGHLMAMSNSQLYRKLMAQTGHSAQALIQSIRLSKAKELLTKTENNVSEIAYDCGFNDPEYFSRVFKKETGISPTDFRNHAITKTSGFS
jgi:signal transduction histidine kinase/DNA-binding response OmpR family regulator/ligand-binding sensor domain-containing protein